MRCLLVDEVDKFVHDKSKDSYNYAAQSKQLASYVWVYPNLVKFVESLSLQPDKTFDADSYVDDFFEYINQNFSLALLVAYNGGASQFNELSMPVYLEFMATF